MRVWLSFLCLAIALGAVAALVTSCVGVEKVPVTQVLCLPKSLMSDYSAKEQAEAAHELEPTGSKPMLERFAVDLGKFRAAERACLGPK